MPRRGQQLDERVRTHTAWMHLCIDSNSGAARAHADPRARVQPI